jgi:hypothetical protein
MADQTTRTTRRAREGLAAFADGSCRNIRLTLLGGELALIDRLAADIRLLHGAWITRSGIVAALIEAAMRTE